MKQKIDMGGDNDVHINPAIRTIYSPLSGAASCVSLMGWMAGSTPGGCAHFCDTLLTRLDYKIVVKDVTQTWSEAIRLAL